MISSDLRPRILPVLGTRRSATLNKITVFTASRFRAHPTSSSVLFLSPIAFPPHVVSHTFIRFSDFYQTKFTLLFARLRPRAHETQVFFRRRHVIKDNERRKGVMIDNLTFNASGSAIKLIRLCLSIINM